MSLFKKTTAAIAMIALLSGIFSTGVSAYSTAQVDAANYLADRDIIVSHHDNPAAYNLDQNVLRQEIAAVARGVAGLDKKTTCSGVYSDVSATTPNNWACYTVEALADNGLIALNEKFRPEDYITKAEALGMIIKAAYGDKYMYDATLSSSWQEQVVAFAVKEGVTSNFTNYDTLATRGFVFELGRNALDATQDEEDDINKIMCELLGIGCDEDNNNNTNNNNENNTGTTVVSGQLEVSLNPSSPAAQTIPSAGLIPFGKFDFTAGREDASIDSITLTREGLSERTDIRRVYFEQNGIRVSNRSNVATDDTVTITFTPALSIKAGSTQTLELIVELREAGATTGAEHRFAISGSDDIDASSTVGGVYPIRTAMMRVGSYKVETVEVREISGDVTYSVGQENAVLSEFRLSTNGDRNNLFKSITLRNAGDADVGSSTSNLGLYRDGTKVSTEFAVSGRDITIYVNDEIENGRSANYQLRGDIIGAERNPEYYQFEVRNTSDVTVVEITTGFSAPIDLSNVSVDANGNTKWGKVKVEGGDFLVSRDTAYALNQTVSSSTSDVVLWAAKANVAEDISVEDVQVTFDAGNLDQFSSLRFIVGDSTVSTYTPNSSTETSILFETNFTVKKGNTSLKILGNLKNNVPNNTLYKINAVNIGKSDVRYVQNDEKVEVKGSAAGIATTVADGTITLTRNDGIDNYTLVPGANDKLVFGFSLRANDVSDIKVTSLSPTILPFTTTTGAVLGVTTSEISNVRLYKDDVLIDTRNNFDFNSLDVTVKKNTSSNFKYVVDFSNSIKIGQKFQLELAPSGINARNADSNKSIDFTTSLRSIQFSFSAGGQLAVERNNSQVASAIFTPSSSQASAMKFDLKATDDDIRITDIYVSNSGSVNYQSSLTEWTNKYNERNSRKDAIPGLITAASGNLINVTGVVIPALKTNALNIANTFDDSTISAAKIAVAGALTASGEYILSNTISNSGGITTLAALTGAITNADANDSTQFYLTAQANSQITALNNELNALNTNVGCAASGLTTDDNSIKAAECNKDYYSNLVNNTGSGTFDLSSSLRSSSINVGGKTVTGDVVGNSKIHFGFGSDGIIVKKGEVLTADVRVAFFDSDSRTNQGFQLLINSGATANDEVSGTVNGIRAVSESNGEELDNLSLTLNNVNSNKHLLMRSKPTIARISTTQDTIGYKFSVTADSNRKITLSNLNFAVTGLSDTGTTTPTWTLKRDGSNTVIDNGLLIITSTGADIDVSSFASDSDVSAGSSVTYVLELNDIDTVANKDRTRNVRMIDLSYIDDVISSAGAVSIKDYNVIPTDATTYRY